MARVKISEFRAKKLLSKALGFDYVGLEIVGQGAVDSQINELPSGHYAIKVDQATKKRNQLGLVKLNRTKDQIPGDIAELAAHGYDYFLVEPMVPHKVSDERFLALQRSEDGIEAQYSEVGGIDIEANQDSLQKQIIKTEQPPDNLGQIDAGSMAKIVELFNSNDLVYLEINPLLILNGRLLPLDAAVEVDSTAELNVQGAWTSDDFRSSATKKTASEKAVAELQATSMAALTLRVMNPNGKILLLLSGGGASLVIADEFDAHDLAGELINYGEYSGNPNEDELFAYTTAAIELLKESKANKKVIVIAGGVANFTDIAATFKGIIRAFESEQAFLKDNAVAVFVRRGGPNQQKGLELIEDCLQRIGLKHKVHGPDVSLAELVNEVAQEIKR